MSRQSSGFDFQLLRAVTECLNAEYQSESGELVSSSLDQAMDRILPKVQSIIPSMVGSNSYTFRVYFTGFTIPNIMDFSPSKFHSQRSDLRQSKIDPRTNHVESKEKESKKRKKKVSFDNMSQIELKHVYQVSNRQEDNRCIKLCPSSFTSSSLSPYSKTQSSSSSPKESRNVTSSEEQTNSDLYHKLAVEIASSGTFSNHSTGSTSISSLPILCSSSTTTIQTIVGLVQLILCEEEQGKAKEESDISVLESLAHVFGIVFNFCQMSETVKKMMVRQKVTLEACSFHSSASHQETQEFMKLEIPPLDQLNILDFKFCDFDLSDNQTCQCILRMFMELDSITKFQIPLPVLSCWILTVKRNYRPVTYHNWRHSLNVTQTMFAMLTSGKMCQYFSDLEQLSLLIACLCHDLDHRGTNNSFLAKTSSPLALLYSTSTLEHHHFDQCILILHSEGNNILDSLTPQQYSDAIHVIKTAIISTDLALYTKKREKFLRFVNDEIVNWKNDSERKDSLIGMMMTASDVSAITKPWPIQRKICESTTEEFFQQGDVEKQIWKDLNPEAMMDRKMKHQLPALQVEFIQTFCEPTYQLTPLYTTFDFVMRINPRERRDRELRKRFLLPLEEVNPHLIATITLEEESMILADCWPLLKPLLDGCLENKTSWEHLSKQESSSEEGEMPNTSYDFPSCGFLKYQATNANFRKRI